MGAERIQADYDALTRIANEFVQHQHAFEDLTQTLAHAVDSLQNGGWVGTGAQAFFEEMQQLVFPALRRLTSAFDQAQATTQRTHQILQEAEQEAANLFRGNGASGRGGSPAASQHNGSGSPTGSGPTTSGPFRIGSPQHPNIQHDNGFLDKFPPREPGIGDRLALLKWRTMLEGSEVLRPDLVDANAAYRHFLDGDGTDRQFSYERYIENDPSGQTTLNNLIADAQKNVEVLGANRDSFSITSDAYAMGGGDPRFPYPQTENWQKTIGAHIAWTSADVQATGTGPDRTYTMTITAHVEDRYNFNPGAQDIATGIPDSDNGTFEVTGLAHQYMNYSTVTRTVTWKAGDAAHPQIVDTDSSRNRMPSDNRRVRNRL